MAQVACFMLVLAAVRDVKAAMENPPQSWIWKLPFLKTACSILHVTWGMALRCAYDEAAPGKRYKKPYKFAAIGEIDTSGPDGGIIEGHGDWILEVAGRCVCPLVSLLDRHGKKMRRRVHVPLMPRNQKGKCSGDLARLRDSAGYPPRMGIAIVHAWLGHGCRELENKYVHRCIRSPRPVDVYHPHVQCLLTPTLKCWSGLTLYMRYINIHWQVKGEGNATR